MFSGCTRANLCAQSYPPLGVAPTLAPPSQIFAPGGRAAEKCGHHDAVLVPPERGPGGMVVVKYQTNGPHFNENEKLNYVFDGGLKSLPSYKFLYHTCLELSEQNCQLDRCDRELSRISWIQQAVKNLLL